MEDAMCAILGLPYPMEHIAMFGVFDGHGGGAVSRPVMGGSWGAVLLGWRYYDF